MTLTQLAELYRMEVEGKRRVNFVAISPLMDDMQENDDPVFQQVQKLMNSYYRNLCVRIFEHRQTNLSFDFEDEITNTPTPND